MKLQKQGIRTIGIGPLDNCHGNFNLAGRSFIVPEIETGYRHKKENYSVHRRFLYRADWRGHIGFTLRAACERVLIDEGLNASLHANATNIEGEQDTVFAAIKRCHEVVHEMGVPGIFTTVKIGTRIDQDQTME